MSDGISHFGVSHHVLVTGVVQHSQIAVAEGFRHGHGNLGFRFHHLGAHFLRFCSHFLFRGYGGGAAAFRFGLGDLFVRFRLLGRGAGGHIAGSPLSLTVREITSGFSRTSL